MAQTKGAGMEEGEKRGINLLKAGPLGQAVLRIEMYKCWFCGREYTDKASADRCHDAGSYPVYRDGTKRRRSIFGN